MTLPTRGLRALCAAGAVVFAACGDGAVGPAAPRLELLVAGGDGQYGTPGERLASPLKVLVRRVDTEAPQKGISVAWTVEGGASLVGAPVGTSDADGVVSATVTLGSTAGPVSIRARVVDQEDATAVFQAFVVDRPEVTDVSPSAARGGDTVTVTGRGFSPNAEQNVVLFAGVRGRVSSVSPTQMRVEVPACLPTRSVAVTAQLGSLVSQPVPLAVTDGGAIASFTAGRPVDVVDAGGFTCLRLPAGRRYLVVAQSAGTVGAARYGFRLTGLVSTTPSPAPAPLAGHATASPPAPPPGDVAARFEERLRSAEDLLVRQNPSRPGSGAARAPEAAPPAVGSQRSFKVLNAQGAFDDVRGVARLVSEKAVLYVDETAPGGGFTLAELQGFASTFDKTIHPVVTGAFGVPSDLDANERVAILFTPTVNRLTARGADGFIGGFFYGLDLLDREGSNRGEIFYALVPDSAGTFSDPRPRGQVLKVTPAILAHEFQHMVHFNERILKRGAEGSEALWLSEGLAQMAEELVALALAQGGALQSVEEYRAGNRTRAVRYLSDPGAVSLIVATGQGSLAERGAGWLHVLYLWDRGGRDQVLARLTQTTLTGTANVAAAAGASWPEVFADWAAAVAVEGLSGPRYDFEYPSVSLRELLATGNGYALAPETLGAADFSRSGSLWSASARHYIVIPPASGYVALRLGGEAGGNAPPDAALRLRVVPLF
ncbi:MAG: hypothetical protein AMXMBFR53_11540 [Gemmatimonadota bacterium]